jgi:hypothetical protein
LRFDVTEARDDYLRSRATTPSAFGPSTPIERLSPAGVIGSLWMNPRFLDALAPNQVLDRDPVTGVTATSMRRGKDIAYISLQTPLHRITLGYDLHSGLLLRSENRQIVGPATNTISLALSSAQ